MAYEKTVKGQFNGQFSALLFILVMLVAITVYWFTSGEENYIDTEERIVVLEEFSGESGTFSGTYINEDDVSESVTVKAYWSSISFDSTKLLKPMGIGVPVYWSEENGYTLYDPNTKKYSKEIYKGY